MLDVFDFVICKEKEAVYETDITTLNLNVPGEYEVLIKIGRKVYKSNLKVVDTIPPKATIVNQRIWNDEKIDANEFVKDIVDITEVKVFYKEEPDFARVGEREVNIVLEDTSNNVTELRAKLTVIADTEAPVMNGVDDQTVQRIGGGHWWNLVFCEDGWYHFDASPRTRGHRFDCFLKTDAEVEEYSKSYRNYYNFDGSLHPATPVR